MMTDPKEWKMIDNNKNKTEQRFIDMIKAKYNKFHNTKELSSDAIMDDVLNNGFLYQTMMKVTALETAQVITNGNMNEFEIQYDPSVFIKQKIKDGNYDFDDLCQLCYYSVLKMFYNDYNLTENELQNIEKALEFLNVVEYDESSVKELHLDMSNID